MKDSTHKIPTLSPEIFRNNHIRNNADELLNDEHISQFFIHSFQDGDVSLNLPIPPHKKTVNDFVFITKGSMTRNLGIESFKLEKNDFLFTSKNSITTTEIVSNDLEGFYCHFSDEFIGSNPFMGTIHSQTSNLNYSQISNDEASSIEFLLGRILQLYKNQKSDDNNTRLISFYLSTVIAEVFLKTKNQALVSQQKNHVSIDFKRIVNANFKKNLSIKEYAGFMNITPNHLNKRVKKETGKTASEIIREVTILEAKVLLLQTKMTVNEISAELGLNDASYFSRLFKNETKSTPSDYRKMIELS